MSEDETPSFDKAQWDSTLRGFAELKLTPRSVEAQDPPNIFLALGVAEKEYVHANLIAWLLDPRQDHRCDTLFLKAMLELLRLDDHAIESCLSLPVSIVKEYSRHVEGSQRRVDLRVAWPQQLEVYIELKVRATEQVRQLESYARMLRESTPHLNTSRRVLAFFTRSGRFPDSLGAHSRDVTLRLSSLGSLAVTLHKAAQNVDVDRGLLALLRDYRFICTRMSYFGG